MTEATLNLAATRPRRTDDLLAKLGERFGPQPATSTVYSTAVERAGAVDVVIPQPSGLRS
jgi:hypothetical protein